MMVSRIITASRDTEPTFLASPPRQRRRLRACPERSRMGEKTSRCNALTIQRFNGSPCQTAIELLLVVCRFLFGLLALLTSCVRCYHAGLAIGCYHNAAGDGCFAILLYGELQFVVVDLRIRPHIGFWITGDGIV